MTKPKTKPKAATRSTARKISKPNRRAQSAPMSSKPATGAHTKHARIIAMLRTSAGATIAREPPGMSPAARALRSDVVRRAASRGGTLRCAKARRVAYRDVDKPYASHRLS